MEFWKKIFRSDRDTVSNDIDFEESLIQSIELFKMNLNKDDRSLLKILVENKIPEKSANEIITLLPMAYVRNLKLSVEWPNSYIELGKNNKSKEISLLDNWHFETIQKILRNNWNKYFAPEYSNAIVFRSSEFDAINNFLNDGGTLDNVILAQAIIKL